MNYANLRNTGWCCHKYYHCQEITFSGQAKTLNLYANCCVILSATRLLQSKE